MLSKSLSFHLEPTFRCNLGCEMCPRFSSEDPHLDMTMDTYGRITGAMGYAHTVDFTGWGESLLHPQIYDMIRMAKPAGCFTAMTTNGTALTEANCLKLLEAGLDHLAVSVDGVTAGTFERIRVGASFGRIVENLKTLSRMVEEKRSGLELAVAFTIQEDNASEIPRILPFMKEVGAKVLHLKHLNAISNHTDWGKSFLRYRLEPRVRTRLWRDPLRRLERDIEKLVECSRNFEIQVRIHSEWPLTDRLAPRHCLAAPLESAYFSFEGLVSPCCYFGHHVARYFQGVQYPASALFFGDIRKETFETIWNSPEFLKFRGGFSEENYPRQCAKCYLLYGK
ncbi:MAG: radical SAM protein [Acidobacteria bacterium]|nr:radical SAM protein [Acidobacteriota bacterium]